VNLANIDITKLSEDDKRELYDLLRLKDIRAKRNRLSTYKPYAKQMDFHAAGASFRERLFMAGNQLGKTWVVDRPPLPICDSKHGWVRIWRTDSKGRAAFAAWAA